MYEWEKIIYQGKKKINPTKSNSNMYWDADMANVIGLSRSKEHNALQIPGVNFSWDIAVYFELTWCMVTPPSPLR